MVMKKRRMKDSNISTSFEQTGGSSKKNNYALKLGTEYEEMDDRDDKSATLSNKDSGNHNASTTCEDVEHGEKNGLVPSTNVISGNEDIDEISSKNSRYDKSPTKGDIPAGGSDNVTADAESHMYNRPSRDVGRDQNRRQTNDTSENTYSALESNSSPLISTTNDATDNMDRSRTSSCVCSAVNKPPPKPVRHNTHTNASDENKEEPSPNIPEKSEVLVKEVESETISATSADVNKPPPKPVRRNTHTNASDENKEEPSPNIPEKSEVLVKEVESETISSTSADVNKPSPKPVRRNTHTNASDENKEEPSPNIPEKSEVLVKEVESETISATSADVNKPPPKPVRRNTHTNASDENKEEPSPNIPEKSEVLVKEVESETISSTSADVNKPSPKPVRRNTHTNASDENKEEPSPNIPEKSEVLVKEVESETISSTSADVNKPSPKPVRRNTHTNASDENKEEPSPNIPEKSEVLVKEVESETISSTSADVNKPSPKPVRRNTHTNASDENKEEPSPNIPEKSEVLVKEVESETISATSADVNKPPPKPMHHNTQGKLTDEPKEAAPPAIPEKLEELEINFDSNAANSKSRDNKVDDVYTVPCSNVSSHQQDAIASTSFSDNPSYTSAENDLNVDNVYSEPELQQPSTLSENTPVENIYESIYSESLQPSLFNQNPEEDEIVASTESDDLCPYSSIYTVPVLPSTQEKPLEVSVKNLREEKELGSGQFGKVIMAKTVGLSFVDLKMGTSTDSTVSVPVAVKMLKASASQSAKKLFEKEYQFMFRLNHPNVIRMLGICTEGTPFIMMEYMENGDLNQILKRQYSSIVDSTCTPGDGEITQQTLINMCTQIASGMNYLVSNNFVHRDIATRNCLVGEDFMVKITDFGMSRRLYESHYYIIKGQAILPIRWMASECYYGKFSAKTDVWAFGCTMWEVFELSKHKPYYGMTDQKVVHDATLEASRSILSSPEGCPEAVYEIMKSCWAHEASERATFEELFSKLSALNV